jgi:prepilin-type processing-associated H-X9-DG protein
LKQLALALHGYHGVHGVLPAGTPLQQYPKFGFREGHSIFVATLPQLERQSLYNTVNFELNIYVISNQTVHNHAFATLWCPSDPSASVSMRLEDGFLDIPAGQHVVSYSSYGGCAGTWYNHPMGYSERHIARIPSLKAGANGAFFVRSALRLSQFTDGLSSTLFLGERNRQILSYDEARNWYWWYTGYFFANLFDAYYPINPRPGIVTPYASISLPNVYTEAASSAHGGGANFAFADGSVRFIKESIDTWSSDHVTAKPVGVIGDYSTPYTLDAGTRTGVYQALATRNGGEVIDSASY